MNDHDFMNINKISLNNILNMGNNQIKVLQDGNEDGDAVNIKQLNEFEDNLVKFLRNEFAAAVKEVYFHTRNPVYFSDIAIKLVQTVI